MTIFSIEEFRTLRSIAKMEQRGDVISNRAADGFLGMAASALCERDVA